MNDKLIITADEAIELLPDGETVHNFAAAGLALIGIDFGRDRAVAAIRSAVLIEIGGPTCKAMRHPLVVWKSDHDCSFFEADMEKVERLETQRAAR